MSVCNSDGCELAETSTSLSAGDTSALAISIISDYICPWCLIAETRLSKALAEVARDRAIDIVHLPFELNPDMPKEGLNRKDYRSHKFGSWQYSQTLDAQVAAAGAADGLIFRHDLIERTPNTFDAHRLTWLARFDGKDSSIADRLLRAYFLEGKDTGDRAVLAALAAEVGFEQARTQAFLDSDMGTDEVHDLTRTIRSMGVSSVPLIIIAGQAISGAQSVSVYAAAIADALNSQSERSYA